MSNGPVFGAERYHAQHFAKRTESLASTKAPMQHGQNDGQRHQQQQQLQRQQAPRPPAPPVAAAATHHHAIQPHPPQQYRVPQHAQWLAPRYPPAPPIYHPPQYPQQYTRPSPSSPFAPQVIPPVAARPGSGVSLAPRYHAMPRSFVPSVRPPPPPGHFPPHHSHHTNYLHPPPLPPQTHAQSQHTSPHAIEAQWVEEFKRKFIPSEASATEETCEPPLRRIRQAIARAQVLIAQLQEAATDVIAIEKRIRDLESSTESQDHSIRENVESKSDVDAIDQLEISRLKLQHDRKLTTCEALKAKLEAMNPQTLFCASAEELAQITRFAKQVQKKQAYRKKAKKRRRVETTILQALQTTKAVGEREEGRNDRGEACQSEREERDNHLVANDATDQRGAQKPDASANRVNARKLLLLIDIKERRKWDMSDDERQEIANLRAMALKCLEPKPRPPQRATNSKIELTQCPEPLASRHKAEKRVFEAQQVLAKANAKRELVDPETIDMEMLISVRRAWDQFLVSPNSVPGASTIPPHFVPSPATPSAKWAIFLSTT